MSVLAYDRRFTVCVGCAGAFETTLAGGEFSCPHCQAINRVAPRDDSRDRALAAAPSTLSEAERLGLLRTQDGKPLVPPPAVQRFGGQMVDGAPLAGARLEECWRTWQGTRRELEASQDPSAEQRLFFLGWFIQGAVWSQERIERVRAVLEVTRDAVTSPGFRQPMNGMLARLAAREGDLAAAEQWLALISPRSADLHQDSVWRITRATLSTKQEDWNGVLRVLGASPEEVPVADQYGRFAGVLRANALERQGRPDEAARQLARAIPSAPEAASVIQANAELGPLCPLALARMREPSPAGGGPSLVRTEQRFTGCLPLLGIFLSVPVGMGLTVLVGELLFGAEVPTGFWAVGVSITVLALAGSIVGFASSGRREFARQRTWTHGTARLTSVQGTVTTQPDPIVEMTMQVSLPDQHPYTAIHRQLVPQLHLARVQPCGVLRVAVDPKDRRHMRVLWD